MADAAQHLDPADIAAHRFGARASPIPRDVAEGEGAQRGLGPAALFAHGVVGPAEGPRRPRRGAAPPSGSGRRSRPGSGSGRRRPRQRPRGRAALEGVDRRVRPRRSPRAGRRPRGATLRRMPVSGAAARSRAHREVRLRAGALEADDLTGRGEGYRIGLLGSEPPVSNKPPGHRPQLGHEDAEEAARRAVSSGQSAASHSMSPHRRAAVTYDELGGSEHRRRTPAPASGHEPPTGASASAATFQGERSPRPPGGGGDRRE